LWPKPIKRGKMKANNPSFEFDSAFLLIINGTFGGMKN